MRKFKATITFTLNEEDVLELLAEEQKITVEDAIKAMVSEFNDEMYESSREKNTEANEVCLISFEEIT